MLQPEIITAGMRFVTVKELSGTVSVYHGWTKFFVRPDAQALCDAYLKKLNNLALIVTAVTVLH